MYFYSFLVQITMAPKRMLYTEEAMEAAVKAVKERRMGLREASRHYSVPDSTLRDRIKGRKSMRKVRLSIRMCLFLCTFLYDKYHILYKYYVLKSVCDTIKSIYMQYILYVKDISYFLNNLNICRYHFSSSLHS